MADAANPPVETPVAEAPAAAAPAVEAPVVDVKIETQPAPEPAPAVEAPAEVAPTSLLQEVGKTPAEPVVEAKPDAPAKSDAPAGPAAPTPEVAAPEWDFKLPETLRADDATIGQFKDTLNALIRPAEGETPSHAAARLLTMHSDAMAAYDAQLRQDQIRAWNDTKARWRTESMADSEIGGAAHQTAMGAVARVRDRVISTHNPAAGPKAKAAYENDVAEFNRFCDATGAGDHPFFLKMLHRMARFIDEPRAPQINVQPPPDAGRKPGKRSLYAE